VALNDRGYLFLGRSESVIDYDDVFCEFLVKDFNGFLYGFFDFHVLSCLLFFF